MRPILSLEKSVCKSECDQKRNQGFGKREGAWTKSKCFFAQKLSNLGYVLNKPMQLKRVTEGPESPAAG